MFVGESLKETFPLILTGYVDTVSNRTTSGIYLKGMYFKQGNCCPTVSMVLILKVFQHLRVHQKTLSA